MANTVKQYITLENIISVYNAYGTYENAKDKATAVAQIIMGCYNFKTASYSNSKTDAVIDIFEGFFTIAGSIIPGEMGGWTIEVGAELLRVITDDIYPVIKQKQYLYDLGMSLGEDDYVDEVIGLVEGMSATEFQQYIKVAGEANETFGQYLENEVDDMIWYEKLWYTFEGLGFWFYDVVHRSKVSKSDPLVIDMNGDGFATTAASEGVHFNLDSNGLMEKVGWVTDGDALLVRDVNGNGLIDDGSELFTNTTLLSNGNTAANGFEALADLDSNHDGLISEDDTAFGELKVWIDENQDGISTADELKSLSEAGIESISVTTKDSYTEYDTGAELEKTSTVTFADGHTTEIGEFLFDNIGFDTVDPDEIEIPTDISVLPNVPNIGNVFSLHKYMVLDETGVVQSLVEQFSAEKDMNVRMDILQSLLFEITNAEDNDIDSQWSDLIDVRKLAVVEAITGSKCDGFISTHAAETLEGAYQNILISYYNCLAFQTSISAFSFQLSGNYISKVLLTQDVMAYLQENPENAYILTDLAFYLRNSGLASAEPALQFLFDAAVTADSNYANYLMAGINQFSDRLITPNENDYVKNDEGQSSISTGFGDDTIMAGNGNQTIYAGDGADIVFAGSGNDEIYGESGDDIIIGNSGNDFLNGGDGVDIYRFYYGDGQDKVLDISEYNVLEMGAGFSADNLRISYSGNDIVISFIDSDNSVTIQNYCTHEMFRNFIVTFVDGNYIDLSDVTSDLLRTVNGTDGNDSLMSTFGTSAVLNGLGGNDTITGSYEGDTLNGGNGDDIINGADGDDYIDGGAGNDQLNGDGGIDTYLFGYGSGKDIIVDWSEQNIVQFGEGISTSTLNISLDSNYAYHIAIHGTEDELIINSGWNVSGMKFLMEDGRQYRLNQDSLTLERIFEGDDTLYQCDFSVDQTIEDNAGSDVLQLNADLLSCIFDQQDLSLVIKDSKTGKNLTIDGWFAGEEHQIEEIYATDGAITNRQVALLIENMAAFCTDNGISWNDAVATTPEEVSAVINQLLVSAE